VAVAPTAPPATRSARRTERHTMWALTFDGRLSLREDYPDVHPAEDEVVLAVRVAGVCSTDIEIIRGYMGFAGVLGHEFVGTVQDGPERWLGKRVVGEINCPCRQCDLCAAGLSNHCPRRTVLGIAGRDGVFAERVALPKANLHEVPSGLTDDQAVFTEPLAAAIQVTRQVEFRPECSTVVLGAGRLGQLLARVLGAKGLDPLLVDAHAGKLEIAARAGIRTAPLEGYVPDCRADVVVDATGCAAGFDLAMRVVRPRGTIVLKSTFAAETGMNLAPLVIDEITVVGSRCGPFDEALAMLAGGAVDVSDLLSARFPLAQAKDALAAAADEDSIKVLIDVATQ